MGVAGSGEALEVETTEGDVTAWQPAEVVAVLQDGWFQARIGHGDQAWSDWFTWQEEGTDWRRPPPRARPFAVRVARAAAEAEAEEPRRSKRRPAPKTAEAAEPDEEEADAPPPAAACLGGGGGACAGGGGVRRRRRRRCTRCLPAGRGSCLWQVRGIQGPGRLP